MLAIVFLLQMMTNLHLFLGGGGGGVHEIFKQNCAVSIVKCLLPMFMVVMGKQQRVNKLLHLRHSISF